MRSYLFASQVILVSCFLFLSLAACVGSEKETAVPATSPVAAATVTPTPAGPTATAAATVSLAAATAAPATSP